MQKPAKLALRAARYWASIPGNQTVRSKFDLDDAVQEASIALWQDPDATVTTLYRRILDAVRVAVPGYRQRNVTNYVSIDSLEAVGIWNQASNEIGPDEIALRSERVAMLKSLPKRQREIAEAWIDGLSDGEAAAAAGVHRVTWMKWRQEMFNEISTKGY